MRLLHTLIAVVVVCGALAIGGSASAQTGRGDWWMFGHDLRHTHRSPYTGPPAINSKWTYITNNFVSGSPAVGADGVLYIGSEDGRLYAIYPNGSKKWDYLTGGGIQSSPAIAADGTIYIGSSDHNLYAINPDGSKKWEFATGGMVYSSPAVGADGTIYVGSLDGKLYAINPADGSKKWEYNTGDDIRPSPAIAPDGTIYIGSENGKLYAIRSSNGTKKWEFTTGFWIISSAAIGIDGTVYVGSCDSKLYAINPDGSQKWFFETGDFVRSSPALGPDGTIYVGSSDYNVYAIEPNGAEKWHYTTGYCVESSPVVGADGTIYIGSWDGNLYAIKPDSSLLWSFPTEDGIWGSPAVDADGTIYIGSRDFKVYAIGPGLGDVSAPSVTVNQAASQADPTLLSNIKFNVEFSEQVTDFGAGDVTLSGTAGATTAAVTNPLGDRMTFAVSVSGMTQTGTVILTVPAGVAHDVVGTANTASTSTDNTVNYTATLTPTNVDLTPWGSPRTTDKTTFSAVYRDGDGYADIDVVYLLINDSLGQSNAALLMYNRTINRLYLKNDYNTTWGTGYAPGTDIVLENSQCSVYVKDTTVAPSGTDLTVNYSIALKAPFISKNLDAYMWVQDMGGLKDGWDRMGIYYNVKPQVVGITPNSGQIANDTKTTLTSVYRDLNRTQDLRKCYMLLCENFSPTDSVFLWYDKGANRVYLKNDSNTAWSTGYAPGTDVVLSNSQCEVYVKDIIVSAVSNTDLSITWSFKLKPSMVDANLFSWMYVTDSKGLFDTYKKVGIHFTPLPPSCVSVVPNSGYVDSETPLSFVTEYSDPNGWGDIYRCYFQVSQTSSQANACLVYYDSKLNKIFLKNDTNTAWGVGYEPGTNVVLENSQCRVYIKDTTVTPSGKTNLIINWKIALKAKLLLKLLGVRMYCRDNEMLNSLWKFKGYIRTH